MPTRCARGVALRLLDDTMPHVDQKDRKLRRRSRGDHVARVLRMPGRIGDDELTQRRREIAIRDVDRDALFALRDQAVGRERQVERLAAPLRRVLDGGELVGKDRARVVEQAADQRALAVVDAASGQEPQHAVVERLEAITGRHQK